MSPESRQKLDSTTTGRIKWSDKERNLACEYFKEHIKNKITPKKHECEQLLKLRPSSFENKDWIRIKTFIYNTFRLKK